MTNLVEMDENMTLLEQKQSGTAGPITIVHKFNIDSNEVEQF